MLWNGVYLTEIKSVWRLNSDAISSSYINLRTHININSLRRFEAETISQALFPGYRFISSTLIKGHMESWSCIAIRSFFHLFRYRFIRFQMTWHTRALVYSARSSRLILLVLDQKSQWMPSVRSPFIHAGVSSLEKGEEKRQLPGKCCFCLGTWGGRRNSQWAGEVMPRAIWYSVAEYKRTQLVNRVILATEVFPVCGHTSKARQIAYGSTLFLHKSDVRIHTHYLR